MAFFSNLSVKSVTWSLTGIGNMKMADQIWPMEPLGLVCKTRRLCLNTCWGWTSKSCPWASCAASLLLHLTPAPCTELAPPPADGELSQRSAAGNCAHTVARN